MTLGAKLPPRTSVYWRMSPVSVSSDRMMKIPSSSYEE